jgi:hypothetical protein
MTKTDTMEFEEKAAELLSCAAISRTEGDVEVAEDIERCVASVRALLDGADVETRIRIRGRIVNW